MIDLANAVYVVGLRPEGVMLHDIGMDVPHQVSVMIPAAKYLTSRDIHVAINQGLVFRLRSPHPGQLPQGNVPQPSEPGPCPLCRDKELETERLQTLLAEQQQTLDHQAGELKRLEVQLREAYQALQERQDVKSTLSEVLALLQNGGGNGLTLPSKPVVAGQKPALPVAEEIPVFVPEVNLREVDASHVTIQSETSDSSVSASREALKKARSR